MANYYFQSADSFEFPEKSALEVIDIIEGRFPEWWLRKRGVEDDVIAPLLSGDEETTAKFLETSFQVYDISQGRAEYSHGALYVASEDVANLEFIAQVLADVMEKDNIQQIITLTGAHTCDKPRAGDFGGVAIAVTRGEYLIQDTLSLARQLGDELAQKQDLQIDLPAQTDRAKGIIGQDLADKVIDELKAKFAELPFEGEMILGKSGCDYSKGDYEGCPAFSITYRHSPDDSFLEKLEELGLRDDVLHDIGHARGYALEDAIEEFAKNGKGEAMIMEQTRLLYEGDGFNWKKADFYLSSAISMAGLSGKAGDLVKRKFHKILGEKINEQSVSTRLRVMFHIDRMDCSLMIWRNEDPDNPGCKLDCDLGAGFELNALETFNFLETFRRNLDSLFEDVFPNLNEDVVPRP